MRFIGNDPNILDAFYKATASGSIAAGKPVIVTAPEDQQGSESSAFDVQAHYLSAVYDTSNDKVVVAYSDPGDSNYGKVVVGTVSGSDVTFGTPVTFESATVTGNYSITSAFDSANNKVVIAYRDGGNSNQGTAIVGTVSGTSISFGSAVVFETGETYNLNATFDDVADKVVIAYRDVSNSQYGTAIVGTVSGTSISFGTATVFQSTACEYIFALAMPNWNNTSERRILIAYEGGGLYLATGTVSGTGISFGTPRLADASSSYDITMAYMSSGDGINRAVCAYRDDGSSGNGKAFTVRAIDTTNNNESAYTFDTGNNSFTYSSAAYDASQQKVLLVYRDTSNSNQGEFVFATPSANGEALTFTTPALFYEDAVSGIGQSISAVYDPDSEKSVVAYRKPNLAGAAKTIFNDPGGKVKAVTQSSATVGTPVVFDSNNVVGMFAVYHATAERVVIIYQRSNYVRARVGAVSGNTISWGSETTVESANSYPHGLSYDSGQEQVVAIYKDDGNSSYGTARAMTVNASGDSGSGNISSLGTPVVYNSATTYGGGGNGIAYDINAGKHLVAFRDSNNDGRGIVATLSGTSISFGTEATFQSATAYYINVTYDEAAQKHLIFHNRGFSDGQAVVATISGTSVSFGSQSEFNSSNTGDNLRGAYDATSQKVVLAYRDNGNGAAGTARVCTISGTSVSFGTKVVFESGQTAYNDTAAGGGKVVVSYEDDSDSDQGKVVVGTVSGTDITFGSPIEFDPVDVEYTAIAYDASTGKFVIAYRDMDNSSRGAAVVFDAAPTNITSENYIGITDKAYTDGQDATVAIVGCIDRNQTSLTAGQQYFVQGDGTLSTTAGSPSVLAGTAISETELVVKE